MNSNSLPTTFARIYSYSQRVHCSTLFHILDSTRRVYTITKEFTRIPGSGSKDSAEILLFLRSLSNAFTNLHSALRKTQNWLLVSRLAQDIFYVPVLASRTVQSDWVLKQCDVFKKIHYFKGPVGQGTSPFKRNSCPGGPLFFSKRLKYSPAQQWRGRR